MIYFVVNIYFSNWFIFLLYSIYSYKQYNMLFLLQMDFIVVIQVQRNLDWHLSLIHKNSWSLWSPHSIWQGSLIISL